MASSLNGSTSWTEPGSEERVANRCTQRHGKLCRKTVYDGLFESATTTVSAGPRELA